MYIYIYIFIYLFIYIYRARKRDTRKGRGHNSWAESGKARQTNDSMERNINSSLH